MKTAGLVGFLFLGAWARGQVLLNDQFSGNTVSSANWQVLLPFGGSTVSQSGGFVTLTERGTLLSQSSFIGPISISGTFTMNHNLEHFNIVARTDGSIAFNNSFAERTGIIFSFSNDGDQISIQHFNPDGSNSIIALASYSLTTGQSYDFTATLNGSALSLSVNGVPQLSATDSASTGNLIAIYSREGFGTSTSVDSITVVAVPEPGTWGVVAGILGLVASSRRRKTRGK